jgi:transcriptional regulator with XRE-family HTH domain
MSPVKHPYMEISLRIKEIRISKGIKQENISFFLDMHQGTYAKLENGNLKIKIEQLINIANYLKVPVSSFFPDDLVPLQEVVLLKEIDDLHKKIKSKNTIIGLLLKDNEEMRVKLEGN